MDADEEDGNTNVTNVGTNGTNEKKEENILATDARRYTQMKEMGTRSGESPRTERKEKEGNVRSADYADSHR